MRKKSAGERNEQTGPAASSYAGRWFKVDRPAILAIIARVDTIAGSALTQSPSKKRKSKRK